MSDHFRNCYTCGHNPETCNPQYDCPKDGGIELPWDNNTPGRRNERDELQQAL